MTVVLALAIPTAAFAGRIYGGITEGGKPIAKGVKVDITCGTNVRSGETDAYGAFSVNVPEQGKCTLKLTYQGQTPTFEVNSYEDSVQYDLILERADGKYTLKRK
jgi:hypothetical protein